MFKLLAVLPSIAILAATSFAQTAPATNAGPSAQAVKPAIELVSIEQNRFVPQEVDSLKKVVDSLLAVLSANTGSAKITVSFTVVKEEILSTAKINGKTGAIVDHGEQKTTQFSGVYKLWLSTDQARETAIYSKPNSKPASWVTPIIPYAKKTEEAAPAKK